MTGGPEVSEHYSIHSDTSGLFLLLLLLHHHHRQFGASFLPLRRLYHNLLNLSFCVSLLHTRRWREGRGKWERDEERGREKTQTESAATLARTRDEKWKVRAPSRQQRWPPKKRLFLSLSFWLFRACLGEPTDGPTDWLLEEEGEESQNQEPTLFLCRRKQNWKRKPAAAVGSLFCWRERGSWRAKWEEEEEEEEGNREPLSLLCVCVQCTEGGGGSRGPTLP